MVKHELSSADSQALITMSYLIQENKLSMCTSTVMLDELNRIPPQYREPHIEVYNALKIIIGHPSTNWIDDNPCSPMFNKPTMHPIFAQLLKIVPDKNDARHLFQAKMNIVQP